MALNSLIEKTVQMQKQILMALFLQISVPLITLLIPLVYFFYSIIFNYYNQSLTNIAITCLSTHGFISTIVMIMVHRPYRRALFDMIRRTNKVEVREESLKTTVVVFVIN
ncbi:Protein CBG22435 [Caenorhabditis briggsae]|uniref:Protein CBG22435 n=1 Tax=Caenorhabditis briggsae TaxID=6238 RepID=A8Y2A3_CAEBR|nr:Protein CBG22435 [Caenorhabditis briggsae]CAP39023.2 Protein CBG22435 [Caenorhabditis briggsae]